MRVLNTQQMREADRRTIDEVGIPSVVLMENAGRQAVAAMEAAFDDLRRPAVGVVCGRGNNGGDGFVVARTLVQRGVETSVFLLGSVADVRGDARTNLEVLGRIGLTVVEISNAQEWELHFSEISRCELIVDAILGTGFHGQLSGLLETVVADINGLGVPIVAIDLPTGLSADTRGCGRGGHRGVDDGDAGRAEDSADPAARRHAQRRSRSSPTSAFRCRSSTRSRGRTSSCSRASACASWCRRVRPIRTRGISGASS